MTYAIRIEELSKKYRLGGHGGTYATLRESVMSAAGATLRTMRKLPERIVGRAPAEASQRNVRPKGETFWALRDVSLEVNHGEVIGIIGRNGAGKSTLLKILSRITEPTSGRAFLRGRLASLLEVGTGFHPELTGRENIYLNGAILGMVRREIQAKFDAIVDFSGIEQFLDTPVKRYSSGMFVRLAFAVAAHLDPEILVVDEVLAVGDFDFQKKCLGKMRDVAQGGRTVLFVSHNMAAVEALCDRGIELEEGKLVLDGDICDVIHDYRRRILNSSTGACAHFPQAKCIQCVTLQDAGGEPTTAVPVGQDLEVRIGLAETAEVTSPRIFLQVDDLFGSRVLTIQTPANSDELGSLRSGIDAVCRIRDFPLAPGDYNLSVMLMENREILDHHRDCIRFTVVNCEVFNEGRGFTRGLCVARSSWSTAESEASP